jgi:hypothetical protein
VIASGLSLAGWSQLFADRRAQVHEVAELASAQAQRAVASGVREYVVALRNLAGLWGSVGRIRPVEDWRANAEVLIESFPALAYVAWVHPDGTRDRVAVGTAVGAPTGSDPVPSNRQSESLLGPEREPDGRVGFRLFLPVKRAGENLGELEARVDAERLLGDVLQQWAPGYAVRVRWGSEDLYRRGEPSSDPDLRWWTLETPLALPGATWTVTLAPTPALARAWLTPDPHYLLAVGLLLAVALGLLTRQLQTSFVRAGALAAGRRSGEHRGAPPSERDLEARRGAQELAETLTHSFARPKPPLGVLISRRSSTWITASSSTTRARHLARSAAVPCAPPRCSPADRARVPRALDASIDMNETAQSATPGAVLGRRRVSSCSSRRPRAATGRCRAGARQIVRQRAQVHARGCEKRRI